MALQVAERAVVGHDLEGVVAVLEARVPGRWRRLPRCPTAAANSAARRDSESGRTAASRRSCDAWEYGKQRRREDAILAVAVPVDEGHAGRAPLVLGREPVGVTCERRRGLAQVVDPDATAIGAVQPRQELGDQLLQLGVDQLRVRPRLGQRVGAQPEHELLVRLRRREHADVADRPGGEQAAHQVERERADRSLCAPSRPPRAAASRRGGAPAARATPSTCRRADPSPGRRSAPSGDASSSRSRRYR